MYLGPLLAGLLFDVHIIYPFVLGLDRFSYYNDRVDFVEGFEENSIRRAVP